MIFERDIIVFLQSFRTPFLDGVFKVMSYFFDWPIVVVLGLILLLLKKYRSTIYFLILQGVGLLVQTTLKAIISRPRPYLVYSEISNVLEASNSSFPSGHSMTCMMAVIMLWVIVNESRMIKNAKILSKIGLVFACVLCVLNRMYLGQHYLSDCLGSFLIALLLGVIILRLFYYRKTKKIKEEVV